MRYVSTGLLIVIGCLALATAAPARNVAASEDQPKPAASSGVPPCTGTGCPAVHLQMDKGCAWFSGNNAEVTVHLANHQTLYYLLPADGSPLPSLDGFENFFNCAWARGMAKELSYVEPSNLGPLMKGYALVQQTLRKCKALEDGNLLTNMSKGEWRDFRDPATNRPKRIYWVKAMTDKGCVTGLDEIADYHVY